MSVGWDTQRISFQEVTELSPDATMVFVDGVVHYANPAAVRLLGAERPEDLLGKRSRELLHTSSHAVVERNAGRLIRGEVASTRAEETYLRLDGASIPVEATATRASFLEGRAFLVFLRDLSDRHEAALRRRIEEEAQARSEAARERERWLRSLIDLLPAIVFVRDARGKFTLVNKSAVRLFGGDEGALLGRTPEELELTATTLFAGFDEVIRSGGSVAVSEREVVSKSGERRVVEGVKVALAIGSDETVVLTVLNDLTERKRLELELRRAQRLEGVERLAGGVAHGFNNLLGAILVYAQNVRKSLYKDDDRYEDMLEIEAAAKRGAELTLQLLTFARSQRTMLVEFDAGLHVRSLRGIVERVLGEQIQLTVEAAEGCFVRLDPGQLEQVVVNLAANARDAIADHGAVEIVVTPRVVAAAPPERGALSPGRYVELRVSDDGVGLSAEAAQHLFEPFFTTKDVDRGTGLGLATCYGIAQAAGGAIWAEPRAGGGTSFVLCLPAVPGRAGDQLAPGSQG